VAAPCNAANNTVSSAPGHPNRDGVSTRQFLEIKKCTPQRVVLRHVLSLTKGRRNRSGELYFAVRAAGHKDAGRARGHLRERTPPM
jgi:hypothetical protein